MFKKRGHFCWKETRFVNLLKLIAAAIKFPTTTTTINVPKYRI